MTIAVLAASTLSAPGLAAAAFAQDAPTAGPAPRPAMSEDMRAQMKAVRVACADDMAKLCPDAKSREDRRACMMQNHDKVSGTCKAALADMRQKMQSIRPDGPGA